MGFPGPLITTALTLAGKWFVAAQRNSPTRHATGAVVPEDMNPRYPGASLLPRGNPENTVLAVAGLERVAPEVRAALLDVCDALKIPVDSLATVIANESGWKSDAMNPLPAAGLIQLTVGANLPGYGTKDAIRAVARMPAAEQLRTVVREYYSRMGASVQGADVGRLYMANFLPAYMGKPESFVLGDAQSQTKFTRAVYELNRGLDADKDGKITVGDVYSVIARRVKEAKGRRVAVDGTIIVPGGDGGGHKGGAGGAPGGAVAAAAPSLVDLLGRDALVRPSLRPVRVADGVTAMVTQDALGAVIDGELLRLPVSFAETLRLAKRLDLLPLSAELSDASWREASVKIPPVGLVRTDDDSRRMKTLEFVKRHNRYLAKYVQSGTMARDLGKDWILDAKLQGARAINYGWRDAGGKPIQSKGTRHDENHSDYSQVCVLVARTTQEGEDLLERYAQQGVPQRYLQELR